MKERLLLQLAQMRHLPMGWDSYGAPMIDRLAILAAQQLVTDGIRGDQWAAVPCPDGGVQLEAHHDGLDIEISIRRSEPQTEG